ncbi:MAG: phosphatidate cytidylyltransferase [Spirochaetaceae bacterium]|jgi:phosphatidate cytidylyltransferase|nr:phosphatidate cytidylyltransferase [Spirochaetaceae bacterium]
MKTLIQRLLLFFIGLPVIAVIVFLLPHYNYLAANLIILALNAVGSAEFAGMLRKRSLPISNPEAVILGGLSPLAVLAGACFFPGADLVPVSIMAGASWILISRIFKAKEGFEDSLNRMAAGLSVIIYPGLFMIWFMKITLLNHAAILLIGFLLLVISNDSAGWAVGMIFGRTNQGFVAASPGKSKAGFIGGFAASVIVGIGMAHFAPQVFPARFSSRTLTGAFLGLVCALAGSLGDLAESVMKRSAAIKDSGTIVPGRGGILDCTDSIALTAPVFYGLCRLLFS